MLFSPSNTLIKELIYDRGVLVGEIDSASTHHPMFGKAPPDTTGLADSTVALESTFRGGQQEWLHYLIHNLHYPRQAMERHIQGEAVVGFTVDQEGKVCNPEIIRSVEYSIDKESLCLISTSPDWVPAVQNGQFVTSYKFQPILFRVVIL